MKFLLYSLICILACTALLIVVPLISFGTDYDKVVLDAARAFGIEADEYRIEFKNNIVSAGGETVQGRNIGYEKDGKKTHIIEIKKQSLRVFTVKTIFHEFAHAAQYKYNLDFGNYNREQHAEMLAYKTMQKSGYWWDSLHMVAFHILGASPAEYRVPSELLKITFSA